MLKRVSDKTRLRCARGTKRLLLQSIWILWCGLCLLGPVSLAAEPTVAELETQVEAALKANNLARAEALYKTITALAEKDKDPNLRAILFNYATVSYQNQDFALANTLYRKVKSMYQDSPSVLAKINAALATAAMHLGHPEEAHQFTLDALKDYEDAHDAANPQADILRKNLASLADYLKSNGQNTLNIVQSDDTEMSHYLQMGAEADNNRDYVTSLRYLQQGLQLAQAHNNPVFTQQFNQFIGHVYLSKQDFVQAIPYLEQALELGEKKWAAVDTERNKVLGYLVAANQYAGNYSQAKAWYDKLRQQPNYDGTSPFPSQRALNNQPPTDPNPVYRYTGDDNKIVRWRDDLRQIQIYIEPADKLAHWSSENIALLKDAFNQWQQALQGRLNFVFTTSSSTCDIKVIWTAGPPDRSKEEMGMGYTELQFYKRESDPQQYLVKDNIWIGLSDNRGVPLSHYALESVMLHEIGHMLGINNHSSNAADMMVGSLPLFDMMETPKLSARDIQTVRALYTQSPQITNPAGMPLCNAANLLEKQQSEHAPEPFELKTLPGPNYPQVEWSY